MCNLNFKTYVIVEGLLKLKLFYLGNKGFLNPNAIKMIHLATELVDFSLTTQQQTRCGLARADYGLNRIQHKATCEYICVLYFTRGS